MGFFSKKQISSGRIAKDRLKLLLISDRTSCSPQNMQMLKNDMIKAVGKYLPIDSSGVVICFKQSPPSLTARIPLKTTDSISKIHTFNEG